MPSASISSVSFSTKNDPASGSTVLVTPLSAAITCWVRRAISAAFSVGRASASSSELVCSELVPPSTAASAAELGDLFKEIVMHIPEEGEARRKLVDLQAALQCGIDIGQAVGDGEG